MSSWWYTLKKERRLLALFQTARCRARAVAVGSARGISERSRSSSKASGTRTRTSYTALPAASGDRRQQARTGNGISVAPARRSPPVDGVLSQASPAAYRRRRRRRWRARRCRAARRLPPASGISGSKATVVRHTAATTPTAACASQGDPAALKPAARGRRRRRLRADKDRDYSGLAHPRDRGRACVVVGGLARQPTEHCRQGLQET